MMGASGLKKRELSPKSQIERGVSLFCGEEIGAEQYIDEWQYMRGRGFLEVRVFREVYRRYCFGLQNATGF